MAEEILVSCENVSKKFCRGLKRSLWYGVQDICSELNPGMRNNLLLNQKHLPALRKDEFWAVNDVSFEVKRGECLGLIGHNGAGKSTLLKMLNGLIKPNCGKITMKGRIGALIELNAGFNPILTGRENVYIYGTILGFTKKEINLKYDAIVDFAEMHAFMEMPFRSYSSGMKVRLGFAVAAQMEPDVLLIDEVLAVGDMSFRSKCLNKINDLISNCAVIFVSHSMPYISRICNSVIYLESGRSKLFKKAEEGIQHYIENSHIKRSEIKEFFITDAKLNYAKIENSPSKKQNKNTIKYKDPFQIKISFNIPLKYKSYYIRLNFLDISIQTLQVTSTELDDKTYQNKGLNSICLYYDTMNLPPGKYYITIMIADANSDKILMRYQNFIHFTVTGSIGAGNYPRISFASTQD